MTYLSAVVYDIEIERAIAGEGELRQEGVEYCEGWKDYEGMGISVVGCYDYVEDRYRVFCKDNLEEFGGLLGVRELYVGFNSVAFDNKVLRLHLKDEVPEGRCYDLLREMWAAHGLGPEFRSPSHKGFSLDATAGANFGRGKTGSGAAAPVQWQRGEVGSVIDYCLTDVWLTKRLFDKVREEGGLLSPRDKRFVYLRVPDGARSVEAVATSTLRPWL